MVLKFSNVRRTTTNCNTSSEWLREPNNPNPPIFKILIHGGVVVVSVVPKTYFSMVPKISGGSFEIQFPIWKFKKNVLLRKRWDPPPPLDDACPSSYVINLEPTYWFPLKITDVNHLFSAGSLVIAMIKLFNH